MVNINYVKEEYRKATVNLLRLYDMRNKLEEETAPSSLDINERTDFYKLLDLGDTAGDMFAELKRVLSEDVIEGSLCKGYNGRYFLDSRELTSGDYVEYLVTDIEFGNFFESGRIEHDGKDYYIKNKWGEDVKDIDGLRARIR